MNVHAHQTYSDVRGNTTQNNDTDLHAKLVLLALTFPRLRIIWSSSPYATSDIFADLKTNRDEPDATKAGAIGAEEAGETLPGEAEATVNQTPQELLRSLPGIVSCARIPVLIRILSPPIDSLRTVDTTYRQRRIIVTSCHKSRTWKILFSWI